MASVIGKLGSSSAKLVLSRPTARPPAGQRTTAPSTVISRPVSPTGSRSDDSGEGHGRLRGLLVDLFATAVVVLVVVAPLLFTDSGFAGDFTNHLWLVWAEGKALVQAGHPSYFINARGVGMFYPFFAFYGGTLYAITGAIADLTGDPVSAFVGVTVLTVAGSYAGMLWLGRELGLRGWTAHAPALVVVTSAYYITNLYGRAAWPEFMATAVLSPLIASGVHLARAKTWRAWPVLVFVVSTVIFTGSHNITFIWGSTIVALGLLIAWLVFGAPRRLPYRRLAQVGGLGAAAVLVNAWFLLPDLAYARNVVIGGRSSGSSATFFNPPDVLLYPLRFVPSVSSTPALYVQAPDWFLAWGLVAGALLLWRRPASRRLRRAWIGVAVLVALVLSMIMVEPFLNAVPFPYNEIQFAYRLGSYLFYAVAILVLVGALALARATSTRSRATIKGVRFGLVGVCAISFGLCVWQLWIPNTLMVNSYKDRREALVSPNVLPHSWYDPESYRDAKTPAVASSLERVLIIDPSWVRGDRFDALLEVPPGSAPIQTNISAGGYFVHISGLERVGRGYSDDAVVHRVHGGSGPVHVVVETTHSLTIGLARALSILAILVILLILAVLLVRDVRERTRARSRPRSGSTPTAQQLSDSVSEI
jgi:hypothetical protein